MQTTILPVDPRKIGHLKIEPRPHDILDDFTLQLDGNSQDASNLLLAGERLRLSDVPVAFPTETVYGLGADATRSNAVLGIYKAKQRPADNPLIVHFASLQQLRDTLRPSTAAQNAHHSDGGSVHTDDSDPIPEIYKPLIHRFWPGPLTIILPNPAHSPFAPEVTAGLSTFGARIPGNVLALALIKLAGVPVAAPSANASTKPSPTAAEHVAFDLSGRIESIIDGGPCSVGVESTVVDGLSNPPLVLRPGGVSIDELRSCPGWEEVEIGYKNAAESGTQPKAPGMKYRHYSPKAPVVLFEAGSEPTYAKTLQQYIGPNGKLGIICTRRWNIESDTISTVSLTLDGSLVQLFVITLGPDMGNIARGVFAALRELDRNDVDAILVEGVDDGEELTAAAVMNRLRKAAEVNAG
ncbi:hypothetical protein BAUCODRAFT_71356 [Baudoinia panamericana UAMH 10762]|uniref:Threonylcarbamoyl-AMP synthase n=1 Tax=Baudoinia panamericana (strain UAMH 10762) TaxID=717646 RepID=M2MW04_BAUPA|nr:uncharacterized protein BAUCODRAFT_71356 [Baudoinia panamericana UAMH 10762]EMC95738.1 hypothetical protein BAUCODRAFT_71356 [Baudoinia panamericana UAMH 10762]